MWRMLAVGMLLATPSFAEPPHAARRCDPAGRVLFEIDQRAAGKRTTATTLLYANGAWRSKAFDTDGKLASTEQGCLEPEQLERVIAALHGAPWKVTHAKPTCALSPRWSTFKWQTRTLEMYVVPAALDDATRPRPHKAAHVSQECL
ncbi:MAG TPA: hypothetical protein VLT45_29075, partial [Kofleriaceae bacterium]|nr:hypothetical protein [Kofleriaceae bacterium]